MKLIKLYETKNAGGIGAVVGEVELDRVIDIDPIDLFEETPEIVLHALKRAGLTQNQFIKYSDWDICKAIYVKNPKRYEKPEKLPEGIRAPQNFCYGPNCIYLSIHKKWADKILSGKKDIEIRKKFAANI